MWRGAPDHAPPCEDEQCETGCPFLQQQSQVLVMRRFPQLACGGSSPLSKDQLPWVSAGIEAEYVLPLKQSPQSGRGSCAFAAFYAVKVQLAAAGESSG